MGNCFERSHRCRGGGGGAHCDAGKKRAVLVEEEAAAAAAAAEEEEEEEEEEKVRKGSEKVTEVKIRITRKQLEDLLRRLEEGKDGDGGGAVVSELLCMTSSCNFRHRPEQWRPSLHVIPE